MGVRGQRLGIWVKGFRVLGFWVKGFGLRVKSLWLRE